MKKNSLIEHYEALIRKNRYSDKKEPILKNAPHSIKKSFDINLYALIHGAEHFHNIDKDLQNDKNFILALINLEKTNIHYHYYPEQFKKDHEIITLSYINNHNTLKYIPAEERKYLYPKLLSLNGMGLESAYYAAQDNIELCNIALKQNILAIQFVPKKHIVQICKNKELVEKIIEEFPQGFKYLSGYIRCNKKYALSAINKYIDNIEFCYDNIKDDKKLATELISKNKAKVYHFSENLQEDPEIQLLGLKHTTSVSFNYLPYKLQNNLDFLIQAIKTNKEFYHSLNDKKKKNLRLILEYLPHPAWIYQLPKEYISDITKYQNLNPLPYIQQKYLEENLSSEKTTTKKLKI